MSSIHKVFVSFHDDDKKWKNKLENLLQSKIISGSVQDGDIHKKDKVDVIRQKIRDEYLHDSSVTIVLVGRDTWRRKHVDWEISASIRKT